MFLLLNVLHVQPDMGSICIWPQRTLLQEFFIPHQFVWEMLVCSDYLSSQLIAPSRSVLYFSCIQNSITQSYLGFWLYATRLVEISHSIEAFRAFGMIYYLVHKQVIYYLISLIHHMERNCQVSWPSWRPSSSWGALVVQASWCLQLPDNAGYAALACTQAVNAMGVKSTTCNQSLTVVCWTHWGWVRNRAAYQMMSSSWTTILIQTLWLVQLHIALCLRCIHSYHWRRVHSPQSQQAINSRMYLCCQRFQWAVSIKLGSFLKQKERSKVRM